MATPDPVFLYCICSESDVQPHVHCQCGICDNKPVSRATAYRHFKRSNQLLAQTASDGGRDDDSSESSCEVEDDNYGLSGQGDTASEADYGSDEEDIASGSHVSVHDMHSDEDQSGQHSQEESVGMASTTEEDTISERIVEAVLDSLELQLELKISQIGLKKFWNGARNYFWRHTLIWRTYDQKIGQNVRKS